MASQSRTRMLEPPLPNFFIVGAPKAGTTSLYYYLSQHPDVYMSPIKEPNYFATEVRAENIEPQWQALAEQGSESLQQYLRGSMREKRFGGLISNWSDYLKLFQNANGEKAIGEASVCYLWSRTAARNIASTIGNAKIIMVLRNPVDRAFSQYKQAVASGLVGWSFREQVRRSLNRTTDKLDLLNPFLEYGLYHDQVERFMKLFPAENLRIYLYEEYRRAPAETMADAFRFLEIDAQFSPDMSEKHLQTRMPRFVWASHKLKQDGVWSRLKRIVPAKLVPVVRRLVFRDEQTAEIDRADRLYLSDYYRDDVSRLETLIRRNLAGWLA